MAEFEPCEQLSFQADPASGYRGIIAIHSTALGPAIGGTRLWHYASDDDAITDVTRLARAMSYKAALAGVHLGGGKSVILAPAGTNPEALDRTSLFRAHGRHVEMLGGRYITAEDVGTAPADMEAIARETRHVVGLPGRTGDPSPNTALGVFRGMQALARWRWGSEELADRTVALQGLGNVGRHLAQLVHDAGARLIVTDVDTARLEDARQRWGAEITPPDAIYDARADIFSPCALGAILNRDTIPRLRVEIVAGGANNQLATPDDAARLDARGILYGPDYVLNAGGMITGHAELRGWSLGAATEQVRRIHDTVITLLVTAQKHGITPLAAADRTAEDRIRTAR